MGGYFRNHYFLLETKRRVLEIISQMEGLEEGKLCDGYTERAVEFARDMIRVQERVAPGFPELRADRPTRRMRRVPRIHIDRTQCAWCEKHVRQVPPLAHGG